MTINTHLANWARTSALVLAAAWSAWAGPAAAAPLVIYSPQGGDARGTFIVEKAKEQAGLDIKFLSGGGGELFDRLVAERNNPQADVVLGLVQPSMYDLKARGLFEAYTPSWAAGLDPVFKDKDGQFHMFWQTPIVVAYNSAALAEASAPKSWLDLARPDYKNKFTLGPIASQTTRVMIAGMLWRFAEPTTGKVSDAGWDFLRKVYLNARALPEGTDYWQLVAKGDMPIILSWFGGIVSNTAKNGINVTFVDTDGGTPIVAESVALIKGSAQGETGRKFIEWFGSPAFMAEYAAKFGQTPAHPDAIKASPEAVRKAAALFKPQALDWGIVAGQLPRWLERVQLDIMP